MSRYFSYFQKGRYDFGDSIEKNLTDITKYTTIFSEIADDISFYTYYTMQPSERLDEISQRIYDTPDFYWTIPLINSSLINTWRDLPSSTPSLIATLQKRYPNRALIVKNDQTIAGTFQMGENLLYNETIVGTLIGKYPTRGYITLEKIPSVSIPQNIEITIKGQSSQDTIVVVNNISEYDAPLRHEDSDGNTVPYYTMNATPISIREDAQDRNDIVSQIKVIRPEFINDVVSRFQQEMRQRRRGS